jgi:hypothetical protein
MCRYKEIQLHCSNANWCNIIFTTTESKTQKFAGAELRKSKRKSKKKKKLERLDKSCLVIKKYDYTAHIRNSVWSESFEKL